MHQVVEIGPGGWRRVIGGPQAEAAARRQAAALQAEHDERQRALARRSYASRAYPLVRNYGVEAVGGPVAPRPPAATAARGSAWRSGWLAGPGGEAILIRGVLSAWEVSGPMSDPGVDGMRFSGAALRAVAASSADLALIIGHNGGEPIASTARGDLRLWCREPDGSLMLEARVRDNPAGRRALAGLADGSLAGLSPGFDVIEGADAWLSRHGEAARLVRTVHATGFRHFALVDVPAFAGARAWLVGNVPHAAAA